MIHRPASLVLKSFEKTGSEDIDKNLEGFSQLARERLEIKLGAIQKMVDKHGKEQELAEYEFREFCPLPSNLRNKDVVSDILSSMKDMKIDGFPQQSIINLLAAIFNFLIPPRGIEVSCFLQRKGKNPEMLGITFRVTDIVGKQEARSFTLWEKQTGKSSKVTGPVERIKIQYLIWYFEYAGEFQYAKKYQNELLDTCKDQKQIDEVRSKSKCLDEKILYLEAGNRD